MFPVCFLLASPPGIHLRPRSQGCLQAAEEQINPCPLCTAPIPPHTPDSWEREGRGRCEMQWECWQGRGGCGWRSPLCSHSLERCLLPHSMLWMKLARVMGPAAS